MSFHSRVCLILGLALVVVGCEDTKSVPEVATPQNTKNDAAVAPAEQLRTVPLFDGKTLEGWEVTNFGSEGDCRVETGILFVDAGYPLSGVTSTRADLPLTNYEISLEAKKTAGVDFFCGLTFPVADSHCTFVVGGWAGVVVGLSCIDQQDAAHNSTKKLKKFEKDRWYDIKVRVEPKRIQAWIDGEQMVDENIEGKEISLRNETLPSRPLGLCNFETTSEFRNIKLTILAESK